MFVIALFIIVRSGKHANVLSADDQMSKMWHIHTYNEILLGNRKNEVLVQSTWMNLKNMLHETSQKQKAVYYITSRTQKVI